MMNKITLKFILHPDLISLDSITGNSTNDKTIPIIRHK